MVVVVVVVLVVLVAVVAVGGEVSSRSLFSCVLRLKKKRGIEGDHHFYDHATTTLLPPRLLH